MSRLVGCALLVAFGLLVAGPSTRGQSEAREGIHQFRLHNGLQLVVAVRPELQLAAVNMTLRLGAIDDPPGQWGIAHLLEHVTLSGSRTVGSLDPQAEADALDELDRAHAALDRERRKPAPDPTILAELENAVERAQQAATRTAESGEIMGGRLEARGAIGLNATTTAEATQFFTWIPPEHVALWISLEAERLRRPILRRFYSERNVVLREVAGLTGGKPTLSERFLHELFPEAAAAHPLAGDLDQISAIDRPIAFDYFRRHYRPENLAIAVVGNVDPGQIHRLCEHYFGDWWPEGEHELPRSQRYPLNALAELRVRSFDSPRGAATFFAFPRDVASPIEDAAVEAIAAMINSPEISPLHRALVQERPLAWALQATPSYPSRTQTSIFLVQVYGNPGVSKMRLEQETAMLLEALTGSADEDFAAGVLAAEMRLAARLDDIPTLASLLAFHQALHRDANVPFEQLQTLRRLDPSDVRRVARKLLQGLSSRSAKGAGQ